MQYRDNRQSEHTHRPRTASSGRTYPSGNKKNAKRGRKQKTIQIIASVGVCLLLAGLITGFVLNFRKQRHIRNTVESVQDVFCSGIFVNGTDIGGMTREQAEQTLKATISERLETTYTFDYNGQSWEFSPAKAGASLNIDDLLDAAWGFGHAGDLQTRYETILHMEENPVAYQSTLSYDETRIEDFIEEIRASIDSEPVNAEIKVDSKGPRVEKQSVNGARLDTEALRNALTDMVVSGTGDANLYVETIYPDITSATAEADVQKLVCFRTDVTFRGPLSLANVRLALSHFNGLVVNPGDVIDFNVVAGKRTVDNGYQEAPEYAGNRTTNGVGGGVCQAATTMYDAMLLSGMTILERHPHTMTVTYVDPSLDATVSDTGKNLVFRNDLDTAIYIYTDVTSEYATVYVYGHKTKYRYVLESHLRSTSEITEEVMKDYEGTYVQYIDEQTVVSEGKEGCTSEGYIVAYDWDTDEEISRKLLSKDSYSASPKITYVGISPRVGMNDY